jgi:polyisoprenoid-binding protein YceI
MQKIAVVIFFLLFRPILCGASSEVYSSENGTITFRSEAAQELINATSHNLHGLIDADNRTFAFRILVRSFTGFNNGLQREHFNENYLESDKFPEATFRGKIIEQIDLTQEGKYLVRAKGILTIHGVQQERIIKSEVTVQKDRIHIESSFVVLLTDHDIKVPKVVHEKIASEIQVGINCDFKKKTP